MSNKSKKKIDFKDERTFIIGREGHIYIDDIGVSKHHAEIKVVDGRIYLRDLNSVNGIHVVKNGKLVKFEKGYVRPDGPIVIGKKVYTGRELLAKADVFF